MFLPELPGRASRAQMSYLCLSCVGEGLGEWRCDKCTAHPNTRRNRIPEPSQMAHPQPHDVTTAISVAGIPIKRVQHNTRVTSDPRPAPPEGRLGQNRAAWRLTRRRVGFACTIYTTSETRNMK